jgi:hypothetical protein
VLVHAGSWAGFRTPVLLLDALALFREREPALAEKTDVCFAGLSERDWSGPLASRGLEGMVRLEPYLPHGSCLDLLRSADILWLDNGPSPCYVSGKMFEYMASGCAILAIAHPEGEAAGWLREAGTATIVPPDPPVVAERLAGQVRDTLEGRRPRCLPEAVRRFSRRKLAARFAEVLARAAVERR